MKLGRDHHDKHLDRYFGEWMTGLAQVVQMPKVSEMYPMTLTPVLGVKTMGDDLFQSISTDARLVYQSLCLAEATNLNGFSLLYGGVMSTS